MKFILAKGVLDRVCRLGTLKLVCKISDETIRLDLPAAVPLRR